MASALTTAPSTQRHNLQSGLVQELPRGRSSHAKSRGRHGTFATTDGGEVLAGRIGHVAHPDPVRFPPGPDGAGLAHPRRNAGSARFNSVD